MDDRPARVVTTRQLAGWALQAGAWTGVALMAALELFQITGFGGNRAAVPVAYSFTPYLLLPAFPIAVAAMLLRRHVLAVASSFVGAVYLTMAFPLVWPQPQPAMPPDAVHLTVAHTNLLWDNPRVGDVVDRLAALDADVIGFSEYTEAHAAILLASDLADAYPYRREYASGYASGAALWSRYPFEETDGPGTASFSVSAVLDVDGTEVRVLTVHTRTPLFNRGGWERDMARIAATVRATDLPTIVVGDFNASYWHPQFRAMLDDGGLREAHHERGAGWRATWPSDRWFPPLFRLDHALVNDGVAVRDADDFGVPGSDHDGVIVDVAIAP
jgi:endonuclease/exonuclease/phosphatase (EEP) superfamily protein YafD